MRRFLGDISGPGLTSRELRKQAGSGSVST